MGLCIVWLFTLHIDTFPTLVGVMVNFMGQHAGLRDAQIAGETFVLGVSVRVSGEVGLNP